MSPAKGEGSSCHKGKKVVPGKPPTEAAKGEEAPYSESNHSEEEEVHRNPNSKCLPFIDSWYDTHSHTFSGAY